MFPFPMLSTYLPDAEIALVDYATNSADNTTYTFTGMDLGVEDGNHSAVVVAALMNNQGSGVGSLVSATIAGQAADIVAQLESNNPDNSHGAAIFQAASISAATGTIGLTWSGLRGYCNIYVFRLTARRSTVPLEVQTDENETTPWAVSMSALKAGAVMLGLLDAGVSGVTWSGLAEDATHERIATGIADGQTANISATGVGLENLAVVAWR